MRGFRTKITDFWCLAFSWLNFLGVWLFLLVIIWRIADNSASFVSNKWWMTIKCAQQNKPVVSHSCRLWQEYSHYSALIRNTRVMTSYTESDAHVKWVTQQKGGLSERIKYMLDHGIGCDVTFKVHNNNRKCRVRYTSRDMTHPDSVLSLLCTIDERASQIRQYEAATGSIRDLCSLDCVCFSWRHNGA